MARILGARLWLLAWLPGLLVVPGACFDPTYPVGIPCSEVGTCPPGQSCDVAAGLCRAGNPPEPDGGGGDVDRDGDGVPATSDCDDGDPAVFPGRAETPYNGVDDDCNPETADDDLDRDDHGMAVDCNDADPEIHPGAVERCNQRDDDCNDAIDDSAGDAWFMDRDGDGFGDDATLVRSCTGEDLVARGGDCDDGNGDVHPDAGERCDLIDNDCDDAIDGPDAIDAPTWYADTDRDGHGDPMATLRACARPDGYLDAAGDCDDGNAGAHPGGVEQCDAVDQDCDGDPVNGVLGDAPACAAVDCRAIAGARTDDGVYFVDPDGPDGPDGPGGPGATEPYQVYCSLSLAGGGWQLVSSRTQYTGALFANAVCLDPAAGCSGTIPVAQRVPGVAPDVVFATANGAVWIRLTGLQPPGGNALLDVILLARPLGTSDACTYPHYCGVSPDPQLAVHSSSPGFAPRFTALPAQFARLGGLWFGNGGGGPGNHVVSLNYAAYCAPGGVDFSDARNGSLGNVACGQPGGIYFRYP
jgi:hypothetical protein